MASETQKQKVTGFVTHLLNNPDIKIEPPLVAENLIINFISKNLNQLKQTFKSPQFFPDLSWDEALQLILVDLRERILDSILPELIEYLNNNINYGVINKVSEADSVGASFYKNKFVEFVKTVLTHKDIRYNFNSVYNIFKYNMLEKYIPQIFERREFVFNELTKVQKMNLKPEEYIHYLKIIMLIKNVAYMKINFTPKDGPPQKASVNEVRKSAKMLGQFMDKLIAEIKVNLPSVSDKIMKMAIKSNVPEEMTELEDASARFIYIFTARYQDYKPYKKIDRGAESPDKSWFNIARKNAEFNGYNRRMIDELYRIAGDNNW
ncbi:MAG: hypothetical protein JW827_12150 [Spirochaetes bacterium]|nr:hypothetical protein [Spirochaetota bacterium]